MLNLITNAPASNAQRNLNLTNNRLGDSLEKLSSGKRVNKAADDAASLAIGSRIEAELAALRTVTTNASQAVSLLQIAEGSYARTQDQLVRLRSLAAQASNGTLSNTERQLLNVEFQELLNEIDRLAADTKFNGNQLINEAQNYAGTVTLNEINAVTFNNVALDATARDIVFTPATNTLSFTDGNGVVYSAIIDASQIAADNTLRKDTGIRLTSGSPTSNGSVVVVLDTLFDTTATNGATGFEAGTTDGVTSFTFRVGTGSVPSEDELVASLTGSNTTALGFVIDGANTKVSIDTIDNSDLAANLIESALDIIITARANAGATQNRVETTQNNLSTIVENTEAARSAYLDADISFEITKFTSEQVLLQSGISTLAQANQIPQNLLALFQ